MLCQEKPHIQNTLSKVTADQLYTATPIQRFINKCRNREVNWVIFSYTYGFGFQTLDMNGMKKSRKVTEEEFDILLRG